MLESWKTSCLIPLPATISLHFDLTRLTLFGSNHDDTIGSILTIKRSSGSTFEDGNILDIVRVDIRSSRTTTRDSHTVKNKERLVICSTIHRRDTTDNNLTTRVRRTTSISYRHTCNLTLERVNEVSALILGQCLTTDVLYGEVQTFLLLYHTHSGHDHLFHSNRIALEGNIHHWTRNLELL